MTLEIGSVAPDFKLPVDGGETLQLSDLRGKNVVLYFYPKDDTPGCTTEAKDFTAQAAAFSDANTIVLGMSKDTVAKHEKFIAKHDLTVQLVSDEEGSAIEAYGVWVEKNMYGRKYMGIERATYLIDAEGIIQKIWRKVRVKGHVGAVLEAAQAL
ncbi:thioredoxin-dependent thiol peroxidase [Kordiimonas laminariae]|uniref:thioredoxin-dependent thiol peroxidase n=1 Tax=Kordiimonas laminariae TaxID=2917717 RepID=UPI001FF4A7ED|nr:thioredoxin-dependent thiol peroxidase [Kordiimonas laminariae]MCK0069866.1 thioredoxin-dependent thiol peroxidase [Kordiimonas laminariae]